MVIWEGVDEVNALMRQLIQNDQAIPEALPDDIENWLRETAAFPEGADVERLRRGSQVFTEHGIVISILLATSSLVTCYAGIKGVKVLTFSYRLGQNAYRRVAETGQFGIMVMAPGGLEPGGQKRCLSFMPISSPARCSTESCLP